VKGGDHPNRLEKCVWLIQRQPKTFSHSAVNKQEVTIQNAISVFLCVPYLYHDLQQKVEKIIFRGLNITHIIRNVILYIGV
jgi:competence transcription factor ComK